MKKFINFITKKLLVLDNSDVWLWLESGWTKTD